MISIFKMVGETIFIFINLIIITYGLQCSLPGDGYRLDCFPESNANQQSCSARGCCWSTPDNVKNMKASPYIPYCYFPTDYPNYQIKSLNNTNRGFRATLSKQQQSFLPKEIMNLIFEVIYETNSRIRLRITDPVIKRFEVPITLGSPDAIPPKNPEYKVIIPSNGSFSFEVQRISDGLSIFKTFGPLLYSDQFIQITSYMAIDHVYGIGEQNRPFQHDLNTKWERIGLWARDNPIATYNNLYGTHPFYIGMPQNGKAFGTYYFNSNAQEFVLQPAPAISYRTTGGILDIFIFTGGTPEVTVSQYFELIGKPMLPPFWALGFHLSRYGYKNLSEVSKILFRNINANIPVEVQWSDIDYMNAYKDFTFDPINYKGIGNFVRFIKQKLGIKYIVIIDPGISIQDYGKYLPFDQGLQMNVFIKDSVTNRPLIGKVWPGDTVFPDFTHPNITKYWTNQIQRFIYSVPVDGLWIDMNEPSNFYDGSKSGCPGNSPYDNPFFVPLIRDSSLLKSTICSSAIHYNNVKHYNLHNLYGHTEAVATYKALTSIRPNRRPFILSRSTFSGSGKYTFHWTGDNIANWEQLANSIRQVLNFNMFGIPMTGADICGFIGDTNEELCIRWMQLGSFYPFMRNHNTINAKDQDPASWSKATQKIMRSILFMRYALLPYFYTLIVKSHLYGGTVMRPLSFEFYSDYITHSIEHQFMIGSSLLINPVLTQGATSVLAYFPAGVWYDLHTLKIIHSGSLGRWINLNAPLETINIGWRGGHIITILEPGMNTKLTRKNHFFLLCALSENQTALGDFYWDDGESLDSYLGNKYSYIQFNADINGLMATPIYIGYNDVPSLFSISVVGLNRTSITSVTVNGKSASFLYQKNIHLLEVQTGDVTMTTKISIQWK